MDVQNLLLKILAHQMVEAQTICEIEASQEFKKDSEEWVSKRDQLLNDYHIKVLRFEKDFANGKIKGY